MTDGNGSICLFIEFFRLSHFTSKGIVKQTNNSPSFDHLSFDNLKADRNLTCKTRLVFGFFFRISCKPVQGKKLKYFTADLFVCTSEKMGIGHKEFGSLFVRYIFLPRSFCRSVI